MRAKRVAMIHDRKSNDLTINSRVAEAVVDDPYSDNGGKLRVIRSVRDDPLAGMYARKQVDEAQYVAGRQWQRHYEMAGIGSIRAIDPGKEAVDGGRFPDPLSDSQMAASDQLVKADMALGQDRCAIIRDILGEGLDITLCATRRGMVRQIDRRAISAKFHDSLEILAKLWGYA